MTGAQTNLFDLLAPASPPAPGSDGGVVRPDTLTGNLSETSGSPVVNSTGEAAGIASSPSETSIHWVLITTRAAKTACGIAMPAYYDKLRCGYSAAGKRLSGTHNRDDGTVTCERCREEMR